MTAHEHDDLEPLLSQIKMLFSTVVTHSWVWAPYLTSWTRPGCGEFWIACCKLFKLLRNIQKCSWRSSSGNFHWTLNLHSSFSDLDLCPKSDEQSCQSLCSGNNLSRPSRLYYAHDEIVIPNNANVYFCKRVIFMHMHACVREEGDCRRLAFSCGCATANWLLRFKEAGQS